MECKNIQNKLIDYIENKLHQQEINNINKHLISCKECTKELNDTKRFLELIKNDNLEQPSSSLKTNFDTFLQEEINSKKTKVISINNTTNWKSILQIAASIIIVISAFLIGQKSTLSNTKTIINKEELKVLALLENQSVSKRILAVSQAEEFNENNTQIIDALINKLFNDKNINVRLAAAEALAKFSSLEKVKSALIKALETEKVPTMQIELIQILAKIQEKRALKPMKKLLNNSKTPTYVKQELEYNIASLF